jgi:hypothetical protein
MLLIFRKDTGEIVDNSGTNSIWPEGPPDELAWRNVEGLDRKTLDILRLHDEEDSDKIDLIFNNKVNVDPKTKKILVVGPLPPSPPILDDSPSIEERLSNLENTVREIQRLQK